MTEKQKLVSVLNLFRDVVDPICTCYARDVPHCEVYEISFKGRHPIRGRDFVMVLQIDYGCEYMDSPEEFVKYFSPGLFDRYVDWVIENKQKSVS